MPASALRHQLFRSAMPASPSSRGTLLALEHYLGGGLGNRHSNYRNHCSRISVKSDKAQRIHSQIRMVLDIDRELINCPQLLEEIYKKNDTNKENKAQTLGASAPDQGGQQQPVQPTVPIPPALAHSAATGNLKALVQELTVSVRTLTDAINEQKTLCTSELKLKTDALRFSYFNMFDFVYGFYGRESWFSKLERRLWFSRHEKEDWEAWTKYMTVFFGIDRNFKFWEDMNEGMYPKSFTEFINNKHYEISKPGQSARDPKLTQR